MEKNRIFDTNVQLLKYRTLKEVIKYIYAGKKDEMYLEIPKAISPGPKATMRCCVFKERAILQERIKLAMGGNKDNPNVVEVIDIACDECPIGGIYVTPACRGCIVHKCQAACPKDAIQIIDKHAVVDKSKCIECGKCTTVCPYNAIIHQHRPCVISCKAKAITINEENKACINNDKCIECGACVYQCPFGAIQDKSYISETIDILRNSDDNKNYKVYAVIAPSIVSQFKYARIEQVVTGIHKIGFHQVVEAALGADIDLHLETKEWLENSMTGKGVLLSSCCPSFVMYVEKNFPELAQYISTTLSPMMQTAKLIKHTEPTAKIVFIGPCTSKKSEYKLPKTGGLIDSVISFEELQAFLDARDIDVARLEDTPLDNASYYGRIFAKSGGLAEGIAAQAEKMGMPIQTQIMNGIDECKVNLMKLKLGKATAQFFEGMACDGGCINGALCITHGQKNVADVDKYGRMAKEDTIDNSIRLFEINQ